MSCTVNDLKPTTFSLGDTKVCEIWALISRDEQCRIRGYVYEKESSTGLTLRIGPIIGEALVQQVYTEFVAKRAAAIEDFLKDLAKDLPLEIIPVPRREIKRPMN